MIQISDKSKCCGCSACFSICPQNCISMQYDEEGFIYPVVDSKNCIKCKACESVCPFDNKIGVFRESSLYAAVQNMDIGKRMESTAGGAFSLIADFLIDQGAIVYAVGYDENVVVCHKSAKTKDGLSEFRGSKYVQSDIGDTYKKINEDIKAGSMVLFVGTPCQVHGLKKYIGENDRLYTIDLLCLGVSSPELFRSYIRYLNEKYESKVVQIQFRNKQYGYSTPNVRVCFSNEKYIEQKYDSKVHANLFFKHYYNVRPSCYVCEFREVPRVSDFTIGDFTEIGQYSHQMDDDKGTTKLWAHSRKGRQLIQKLSDGNKVLILGENISNIVGGPKHQIRLPERRTEFFQDVRILEYKDLIKKWAPESIKGRIAGIARPIINMFPFGSMFFKQLRALKRIQYNRQVDELNKLKDVVK
ncbi:Coenzyme F420 hydrogenase/dehydrogenase, beta subunit C-terminal domain [Eisenbergiella massiliensis]|uniref:Coenzyme F420 hydrogenase/dehydrogenase, beta subunit C-terminal domain n=1 Tax=Eisenbergiella massiliensis TaxID=1720294 RepID=UPI0039914E7A